jgi:formylglycine-generating enzyme required for sulfatase activity
MHFRWDFGVGRRVLSVAVRLINHNFKLLALSGLLAMLAGTNQAAAEARFFRIAGPAESSITEFRPDGTLVWTNALAGTNYTVQTVAAMPGGTNWVDYVQLPVTNHANTNWIVDFQPPAGMALIPAGSFTMGDTLDGDIYSQPVRTVYVSAYFMDKHEVTKALWDEVYNWATNHGYSFDYADSGQGKANNHPAHTMTWYDAVKWCNARSEKEGQTPAYYTDAAQTVVYRTGQVDVDSGWVLWNGGYRLPTEAEWEKAARGGTSGWRFPWGNTINQSQANYNAYPLSAGGYAYDENPTIGFHTTFNVGVHPYTSPVGYFAPNGYGLYDMVGNVWEWCWDWYGSYTSDLQPDPRGPEYGLYRVDRGGSWNGYAFSCRTAHRGSGYSTSWLTNVRGFRCVRAAGQ